MLLKARISPDKTVEHDGYGIWVVQERDNFPPSRFYLDGDEMRSLGSFIHLTTYQAAHWPEDDISFEGKEK